MAVILPDPPSVNDLYNTGKTEVNLKRPELTVNEGDIVDMVIAGGAAQGDSVGAYAENRFKATYVDGASGDDLTLLADDHLGIQRFPANPATGVLHFHRDTFTAGAGTISAGFQVATQPDFNGTSFTFATDVDLTFGATQLDGYVTSTAVQTGPGSNVAPATITRLITSIFDNTIAVTNDNYFAGGELAETDENLRNRYRGFFATIRRGTLSALAYGALQVNGVFTVNVVEEIDPAGALDYQGQPAKTGVVDVFVGDQNGNSSPTMVNNVITELELWRCAGSVVNVFGSQFIDLLTALGAPLQVVVHLRLSSGLQAASIQDKVQAAVVARVNRLNPGDDLTADIIKQAVLNVDLDNITGVDLQYIVSGITHNFAVYHVEKNQVIRTTTSELVVLQGN